MCSHFDLQDDQDRKNCIRLRDILKGVSYLVPLDQLVDSDFSYLQLINKWRIQEQIQSPGCVSEHLKMPDFELRLIW